jgi:hypothetical protein
VIRVEGKNYFAYRDNREARDVTHKTHIGSFMFMVRRIECYVIKENDLLGTNSVCRREEKGLKGLRMKKKATRGEEM